MSLVKNGAHLLSKKDHDNSLQQKKNISTCILMASGCVFFPSAITMMVSGMAAFANATTTNSPSAATQNRFYISLGLTVLSAIFLFTNLPKGAQQGDTQPNHGYGAVENRQQAPSLQDNSLNNNGDGAGNDATQHSHYVVSMPPSATPAGHRNDSDNESIQALE